MARTRKPRTTTQRSRAKQALAEQNDPQSLAAFVASYLEWLKVHNYSPLTVESRELYLGYFVAWCTERGLRQPREITRPVLERYQRSLYHHKKRNGEPMSFHGQRIRLVPLRAWFKWLAKQNYLLYNPASELELPKLEHRLPKHILTTQEVEQILALANLDEPTGIRDRAMLEALYSTGMRRAELASLSLFDLDRERGTVMIRQGKGKKDRMIPIGDRAMHWIERYQIEVRPALVATRNQNALFLTTLGEAFTPPRLTELVRDYVIAAKTGKSGSCHLFRHTMATLMLENGADIRFIQAMLGHAELSTTQIYTQVSIRKLKEIHSATHPEKPRQQPSNAASDDVAPPATTPTADELLNTLAAEAREEDPEA
jgi:integrase/recombinase XerD